MEDLLLKKYKDYIRLQKCKAEYRLSNSMIVSFEYKKENFIHMLGLHKLRDIQVIKMYNDKSNQKVKANYVLSRIKKGKLTDSLIKASVFYSNIKERYENFSYENLTTLTYTDAIINFNPTLIKSKLKSIYILYEEKEDGTYNHLGISKDNKTQNFYIETFFHQVTDMYIKGQTIVEIDKFTLYAPDNQIIVTDSFNHSRT